MKSIQWTPRAAAGGYSGALRSIARGAGVWVAVGDLGEIQTSPDGITWTHRTPAGGYTGTFRGVAWSSTLSLFCAVGSAGSIQTSPDGTTWTARTAAGGFVGDWWDVCWDPGNSQFVAVGQNVVPNPDVGEIQRSTNGTTWLADSVSSDTAQGFFAVAANADWAIAGMLAGADGNGLIFSADGDLWFGTGAPNTWYPRRLAAAGARFVAAAAVVPNLPGYAGAMYAWEAITGNALVDYRLVVASTSEQFFGAAHASGEEWIALSGDGVLFSRVWRSSDDGQSWERDNDIHDGVLTSLAFDSGQCVAVGAAGAILHGVEYTAPDTVAEYLEALQALLPEGPAWTREPANLTELLHALAVEPARVDQRVRDLLEESDSRTATELLDEYFREAQLPGPCDAPVTLKEKREYLHAHRLGFGDPNQQFWIDLLEALTLTGVVLTNRHLPFTAGSVVGSPLSNDEWQFTFALVHDSGGAALNARAACKVAQIAPLHTQAIVAALLFEVWETRAITGGTYRGIAQDGSVFVAVGDTDTIRRSTDLGINWTSHSVGTSVNWNAIASFGPGKFVCCGNNGKISRSSDGGQTWGSVETVTGTPTFNAVAWDEVDDITILVAVGNSGAIHTGTTGGTTWTQRTAAEGYTGGFSGVAAHAGHWVAVGGGATPEIQYSQDGGATWKRATFESAFLALRAVRWHQGFWYAAGDNGLFYTSRDGIVWSIVVNDIDAQDVMSLCGLGADGLFLGTSPVASVVDHRLWRRVSSKYEFHERAAAVSDSILGAALLNDVLVTVGGSARVQRSFRV